MTERLRKLSDSTSPTLLSQSQRAIRESPLLPNSNTIQNAPRVQFMSVGQFMTLCVNSWSVARKQKSTHLSAFSLSHEVFYGAFRCHSPICACGDDLSQWCFADITCHKYAVYIGCHIFICKDISVFHCQFAIKKCG